MELQIKLKILHVFVHQFSIQLMYFRLDLVRLVMTIRPPK